MIEVPHAAEWPRVALWAHVALCVTSPHTLATCRARARIESLRLGTWMLEAHYIPPDSRRPFCNAPVVARPATIRGRCNDAAPGVGITTINWDDVDKNSAGLFVEYGHDRDFLTTVAEHMWRKMHRDARRVRRHMIMRDVANLANAGFSEYARELRKIKLDEPARTV